MALTHSTATRSTLADAFDDVVNTGAGTATLVIKDGATPLVTIDLQSPAFGAASSGVITLAGVPLSATASAGGTADGFDIEDRDGTVVASGTVTATGGGGDIELDNTSIASDQTVEITSLTYTAPS